MTRYRDHPAYHLTRHFFSGLFDLGFLSEAGRASFTQWILGICAAFLSFGLLLMRIFTAKYAYLMKQPTPEPYRDALLADHAFMIAVPMWIVAFVTVLVGHALFPDETDFRVLMPLPVRQRLVLGSKLLALLLFTGLFTVSAHIALVPLFALTTYSPYVEYIFPIAIWPYWFASLLGSAFAVLAIMAVQGFLLLTMPPGRLLAIAAAVRSVMLCVLVLSLPLLMRLPAVARQIVSGDTPWLTFAPPVWFMALERLMFGDARFANSAMIGLAALALAGAIAAGTYVILYRHFDRVVLRKPSAGSDRKRFRLTWRPWPRRAGTRQGFAAVRAFTLITLRRSVMHQGILVVLSAIGAGLVFNSLISADIAAWQRATGRRRETLIEAVVWAPFVLVFVGSLAARAALAIPVELRANWVFRMTEPGAGRVDQLKGAAFAVSQFGVIVPVALMVPIQWLVLGPKALIVAAVATMFGALFVEVLMRGWGRIPFTCSYLPGKGFIPQTILIGLVSFVFFTTTGNGVAYLALRFPGAALVPLAIVLAATAALRFFRLRSWRAAPLEFEDVLPSEVNALRLSD